MLFPFIKAVLKHKPKYDFIFLSIGGSDLLVNQDVYLDPSIGSVGKVIF
jgi:hypothetical protein